MDREIEAMGQIAKAMESLDQDAIRRVLKWAIERFQPRVAGSPIVAQSISDTASVKRESASAPSRTFLDLAEIFDAVGAQSGIDRVLVVAYWFQMVQGDAEWDSQRINTELKHLGYPSTNITRDLDFLMARSPKQVMQTRKHGTSKQARKLYKLTREGVRAVEAMLAKEAKL